MKDSPTPIRQQYLRIKQKYPQAIVLFRLGDFYETFDEDARTAARELEIVLTSREMGKGRRVPMAGIPYHALDNYLARFINRGHKVAICEQVTRPGETKGLVRREVVRVVTPGTVIEPGLLDSKSNNYLVSVAFAEDSAGIAHIDVTTSEFATTQVPRERVSAELERLRPSEVIIAESAEAAGLEAVAPLTRLDDRWFALEVAERTLLEHFGAASLDGYGCGHLPRAAEAAGAIIRYLQETQLGILGQVGQLTTYSTGSFMALDEQAQANLELFRSHRGGNAGGSLLAAIDLTRTAMGGRLLRRWLGQPLLDLAELGQRQDAIAWFCENTLVRGEVIALLGEVADIERLINRVKGHIATPRELVSLRRSLETIPRLQEGIPIDWLRQGLKACPEVTALIAEAIVENPPAGLDEGGVVQEGFSPELDNIRQSSRDARQHLARMEQQERERTGIKSLKVGYNKVFGYYIEMSRANLGQAPEDYIRKQTLTNGERFFTPELKEYEALILNARDRIAELEGQLFRQVCQQVGASGEAILDTALALAHTDVLSSLAEVAVRHGYIRPTLTEGREITIKEGRHPVVERGLAGGEFVPNDTELDNDGDQLVILTGPNMSGKSTYLRQVALLVLLAQTGSFVPATTATIGLVDRIFTRIGAREDIAAGQSTFMVEMVETANILNNATPRSLLILDEIGRGTSTYDGLAIARAVTEYIHNHPRLGAKTLFATHYHEMVELASFLPRARNYNVAVSEESGEVVFLYRILPGGVDKSYGIHVGQLAGLPRAVVSRARQVLAELEDGHQPTPHISHGRKKSPEAPVAQIPLFGQKPPVLEELEKLDINSLTPLEAITRLYELQKKAVE